MGSDYNISLEPSNSYTEYGRKILEECEKTIKRVGISSAPIWEEKKKVQEDKKETEGLTVEHKDNDNSNKRIAQSLMNLSNPANKAYMNATKKENNLICSSSSESSQALFSTSRLVETIENIDDANGRYLSFLTETAPESGNILGSLNYNYENGTSSRGTTFLGIVENRWQNKQKTIYTKLSTTFGYETYHEGKGEEVNNTKKIVGNVSFDGRYDGAKNNFIYGAGAEYNSYSNDTQVLNIHAAAKHKPTNIGANITRRTTFSKDTENGKTARVSNIKLKIDILSNKTSEQAYSPFSVDTSSSALPQQAVTINNEATNDAAQYIKSDRKNGWDVDFKYDENECGFVAEYNRNLYQGENGFFAAAPVIGLHDYTDPNETNNNESVKMTGGVVLQAGKKWANGQTFKGTITTIGNRIVKTGYKPYDSDYVLANFSYNNPKAQLTAELDAATIKSGESLLKYAGLYVEKQMKNSNFGLTVGVAKSDISGEVENLFNVMATYKYNFPYKTKK